ncbi:hypothetical protein Patl1_19548 [Pistacia atlantica]|uniref:Uncharacterized protein n=1 Tax=Pistacia atlantica TaxID=434234 RepID=A0ACC1BYX7_9ROSI|nr:hypothetical protein Patl1_19548 [Pistacia atlantica]
MSTLILTGQTSAREDAMRLHRAFKDVNVTLEIDYPENDLLDLVIEMAVLLWMHDPATRDAMIIKTALGNDLKCATEVICSRTPSQIQTIKQIYVSKTGIQLEYDIERRTSGDHKKLLLAYVSPPFDENPLVNKQMAESDANALYRAGEKKFGTDEKTFIRIFSERSRAHLAEVANLYNKHGSSLQKAVKKETSGLFEFALLTILQCAQNPGKYFAKFLNGTDGIHFTILCCGTVVLRIVIQAVTTQGDERYRNG